MEREKGDLRLRQEQFAALLGVEPEVFRGLKACNTCGGQDYEWTDWGNNDLDDSFGIESPNEAASYRAYLAESSCKDCGGTGFEGGSFKLTKEEWEKLGSLSFRIS